MRLLLICLLLIAVAPASSETGQEEPAQWLAPFKQQLMQALRSGLEKGPANAIDVCRVQAPAIAARVAPEGVQMGRSSHRLRNPDNAPADWLKPVIAQYLESTNREARELALTDGRKAWVEPIITAPMCLGCHGSDLSPAVQATLAEHYPYDQATGFNTGDLRGVFWVTWRPE